MKIQQIFVKPLQPANCVVNDLNFLIDQCSYRYKAVEINEYNEVEINNYKKKMFS